jgi:hypothetical protein
MPGRVAVTVAAIGAGVAVEIAAGLPGVTAAADQLAGLALIVAGIWNRSRLAILAGVLWFAGDLFAPLAYAHRGPLVHLIAGRRSRAATVVVTAAYIDGFVPALARAEIPTLVLALAMVAVSPAGRARLAGVLVAGTLGLAAVARALDAGGEQALLSPARSERWWCTRVKTDGSTPPGGRSSWHRTSSRRSSRAPRSCTRAGSSRRSRRPPSSHSSISACTRCARRS